MHRMTLMASLAIQEERHSGLYKGDAHLMDRPKSVALIGLFSSGVRNRKLSGLTSR